MNRKALGLLLVHVGLLMPVGVLSAPQDQSSNSPTISPSTFKQLQKIEGLIEKPAYAKALKQLNTLLPKVNKKAFEKAIVLKTIASVYALQGKYSKASEAMEKSLATKALSDQQEQQSRISLAQLYIGAGKYKQAAEIIEPWIAQMDSVSAEDYILLANLYAQLKRYRKALSYAKKAIAASQRPKESWYQLLLALNYEIKDYRASANALEDLIRKFSPKKEYWEQLAAIYQQMKQYKRAAAVKELAYREGILDKPEEILDLVNFYLYIDAPYKAGNLLQHEIEQGNITKTSKNYELLANAWTQSQEFDLAASALKKAAELSNKGELYFRLGRILIEQENWSGARSALGKAFDKGQLNDPGNAHVLYGMASYEMHFKNQAVNAFRKAQGYKKTRKIAQQWLNYINSET